MKENFASSLAAVLVHEGGFVDDRFDPGGATNRGVTQAVYDNWRSSQELPHRSVRAIGDGELSAIYRKLFWDAVSADSLPAGVDYSVFDFAVNSGPSRAARYLQRAVGVTDDGKIGPLTLAAAKAMPAGELIERLSEMRLAFLQQLSTFPRFGGGWTARVASVEAKSKEMAG